MIYNYLVAVAEHRHFGRAAESCFVSQPTLSTQLKKLEETLGIVLFERSNRRVMLTPQGEQIVQQTQRILVEVNSLMALSEQLRDPMGGDLRVGIIPTGALFAAESSGAAAASIPKLTYSVNGRADRQHLTHA